MFGFLETRHFFGPPNKSEAISYSPGPAWKGWQQPELINVNVGWLGSHGIRRNGKIYVGAYIFFIQHEPNLGVYIYIYHTMDPMEMLNLIFCDLPISMCFFQRNQFRKAFFSDSGATTIPLKHVQVHVKSQ